MKEGMSILRAALCLLTPLLPRGPKIQTQDKSQISLGRILKCKYSTM